MVRDAVRRLPFGRQLWQALVGVSGLAVIVIGVILLPLPGPGWLIIFLGLGIWGTEFAWAQRLLHFARGHVARWSRWILARPQWLQVLVVATGVVLLAALALGSWWLARQI